ncbi:hypothetical protein BDB01DRAFT_902188 [Pilobolus umbonatus]|nr:hypothetical protein BDB01DRAFT_902188 [Pilobolus umbonatus]
MTIPDNDNWEFDLNAANLDLKLSQRKGVYSTETDKDLVLACERYKYNMQHVYSDDDDTSASITSSMPSEDIYSVSDLDPYLDDLDSFMYEPVSVHRQSVIIHTDDHHPGIIQKLGKHRLVHDQDDWNHDIEIPVKGITLDKPQHEYEAQITVDEEEVQPVNTDIRRQYEHEEEDDSMGGLEFPVNMALLSKRLEKRKMPEKSPPPIHRSQIPSHIKRETDDDDFLEGLNFQAEALFNTPTQNSKQKKAVRSRVPRLAIHHNENRQPNQPQQSIKKQQSIPDLSRHRFKHGTIASRQREAVTAAIRTNPIHQQNQLPSRLKVASNIPTPKRATPKQDASSLMKRSANGITLIARPKTKVSYGLSKLDNLDNLNDLSHRPNKYTPSAHPKGNSTTDPDRPWRSNMTRRKPTLISPNEQNLKNEYNDMKYDSNTHSWKGNEKSFVGFQAKTTTHRRPFLITNMQRNVTSKYATFEGNNMIFNSTLMRWEPRDGVVEPSELDLIDDLVEDNPPSVYPNSNQQTMHPHVSAVRDRMAEFRLSVEMKRQMIFEQESHEEWMQYWPLQREEPMIETSSGHKVGASKYRLT